MDKRKIMKNWGFPKINETLTNLKPLKKYIVKYRKILAVGFLFVIFGNIIQICEPIIINNGFNVLRKNYIHHHLLAGVFEYLNIDTTYELLIFFAILYLLVSFIRLPLIYFHRLLITSASKRVEYDLRNELFCHLQKLPLSYYHQQKTGDTMARFSNDIRSIDEFAQVGVALGDYLILAPFSIVYLYLIGKALIFYSLIPLIGVLISAYIFSRYIYINTHIVQQHFGLLCTKVQKNLSGIRILKSYVQEDSEINNYQKINRENVGKNMALCKIRGWGIASVWFLTGLGQLIFLWLGCSSIISGKITPGNFAAFFYQLNQLIWPILILGTSINLFQGALARMERINEILLQEPDIEDSKKTDQSVTTIKGEVELKNLTFSLEKKDKVVLRNINIRVEIEKSIGIIGNIGSGKSTLVNLISRLYKGPKGTIFIDRYPIEKIPLKILRASIGYVPQETFLFSGSIKENICFGSPQVSQEFLDKASIIAHIKKDIDEFPQRYETLVGERGVNLSGGQKQRIAIARAVIIQPKILLLDNALSQVDAETEKEILKNLTREMKNCTVIFVSNRISTIKNADLIVVLIKGQIVESGAHNDLLKMGGFYSAFYKRELLEEELEAV